MRYLYICAFFIFVVLVIITTLALCKAAGKDSKNNKS